MKRLVEEAVVLKKLVEVALVPVAVLKVNFCRVLEPMTKRSPLELMVVEALPPMLKVFPVKEEEKREVEVAEVEVLLVIELKMWPPVQVGLKAWSTVTVFTLLERPVEKVRGTS